MENLWYHGRTVKSTSFDYQYTGKGDDQEGAGFYFTSDKKNARIYSETNNGIIMTVKLHYQKLLPTKGNPKTTDLKFMIIHAPSYQETLYNFGENLKAALIYALNAYSKDRTPTEAMQMIENDFYRSHSAEYLINLTRLGYDGHIVTGLHSLSSSAIISHFICYNPKIIEVLKVENV
jgi:hypothetical protein